jgi:glucokinase
MVSKDWAKVTPFLIYQAAAKGDELAIEVFSEVGTMLGVGIGTMINIFAPEIVAIGGQIANADEFLLGPARNAARNIAVPSLYRDCTIVKAEQLEDAGMLGAAALAIQNCAGSDS